MMNEFYMDSVSGAQLHVCSWEPDGEIRAVVQIVHGIAEHISRYGALADYLNQHGIYVIGEDHMGHGGSVASGELKGYFEGGWFAAVADTYALLRQTREKYPEVPYVLLGHSMGSFMARTILAKYPDSGISGCIISGTAWMGTGLVRMAKAAAALVCKTGGERKPSELLKKMSFGSYNQKVEHPRTEYDWLSRDDAQVDLYIEDPMCGFTVCAGLQRSMAEGISFIQKEENLLAMDKNLPVFFVAGGDDPVGNYGKGVYLAAEKFRQAGMTKVDCRIYPLCRHEIFNEINRREIFEDLLQWINETVI